MKVLRCSVMVGLLMGIGVVCDAGPGKGAAAPSSLRGPTLEAFNHYLTSVEDFNARTLEQGPFLWIDGLNSRDRSDALAQLMAGKVLMRRLSTKAEGRDPDLPGGMIHDWQGMVFISGAKLDAVLRVLEDYNHHATYFAPDVEKSHIESHAGDDYRVFMRFRRHKVVTVVLNTTHDVTYYRDTPIRAHSRSSAVRIAQVENAGEADEREKTPGEDDGFLWKMETWWRMEERDGGVYVQNEAVTLTRNIPTGLGWLIEPFITKIPKETLEFTLQATRNAVLQSRR